MKFLKRNYRCLIVSGRDKTLAPYLRYISSGDLYEKANIPFISDLIIGL